MRNIKALQLLNEGRLAELKAQLQNEIYEESLKSKPNARRRYSAMKKYFSYKDSVREVCQYPAEVEFEGKKYTSFTNSYSLALTTEPIGEIELIDPSVKYPDISRLIDLGGEIGKINFERAIAEAKSKGYKLKKSNLECNDYLLHYEDAYFRMALVDCTYGIIADGEEATVHYHGKHRPMIVENDIGVCVILPIRFEGGMPGGPGVHVIEAIPKEGDSMSDLDIAELISRRRRQVLVHSVIYYRLNDNLISDVTWTKWANELDDLQKRFPDIAKDCPLAEEFKDFDPSTGFNLALNNDWAYSKAWQLVKYRDKKGA